MTIFASLYKRVFITIALVFSISLPVIANTGNERPLIPNHTADDIAPLCQSKLAGFKEEISKLEGIQTETAEGSASFFRAWNHLQIEIEDLQGPIELLSQVSPDMTIRTNAEACSISVNQFATQMMQNEKLYKRIRLLRATDGIERKLRHDILEGYKDAGVSLLPKKRARVKEILNRLAQIGQEFSRNIRDNSTKLTFTPDEVKGLPEAYFSQVQRDSAGNYLLGFSYPEYVPFMQYADNGDARRRYQFAFVNRGTPKNLALLQEAVKLRHEWALLSSYRSYAEFALRRRMAQKPGRVDTFLNEVEAAITQLEKKELEELRVFKAQATGQTVDTVRVERWDVSYWQEKLKQARYQVDSNKIRKYFPTSAALPWVMGVSSTLYDIEFKRVDVPAWHADVQYYDVLDKKTGKRISGIYVDLFPRDGKYGHAAAFGVRGTSSLEQRTPVSVLVANLNREGLDNNELETLLHEFGHILHGVLSKTRFVDQAGTSVERDFVEAPSQMYENWAHDQKALSQFPSYCKAVCPVVDGDLLQRMNAARKFGRGIQYARQLLYAKYDMAIHGDKPADVMALWIEMEGKTPLGYVAGTEFPGQFNHAVGGYAAAYYSYLWSEVLALDMLSRFERNLMNPPVGQFYRKTIVERGSEISAERMVRNFLGRESNSKAFYEEIAGKKND